MNWKYWKIEDSFESQTSNILAPLGSIILTIRTKIMSSLLSSSRASVSIVFIRFVTYNFHRDCRVEKSEERKWV